MRPLTRLATAALILLSSTGCLSMRGGLGVEPDLLDQARPTVGFVEADIRADSYNWSAGYWARVRGGPEGAELGMGGVGCVDSETWLMVEGCLRAMALEGGFREGQGLIGGLSPAIEIALWVPLGRGSRPYGNYTTTDGVFLVLGPRVGFDWRWTPAEFSEPWMGFSLAIGRRTTER